MFEAHTGKKIEAAFLLQLHPSLDSYKVVKCANLETQARAILAEL